MSRTNIIDRATGRVGWFDPDTATKYEADTDWDGNNWISVITGSQWVNEFLFRTRGGRWVLNVDATRCLSRRLAPEGVQPGSDTYLFITDDQAREWLIRSKINDEAIVEHFGALDDEHGPGGRPPVGDVVNVRLTPDLLAAVETEAQRRGQTRAATIRGLLAQALESTNARNDLRRTAVMTLSSPEAWNVDEPPADLVDALIRVGVNVDAINQKPDGVTFVDVDGGHIAVGPYDDDEWWSAAVCPDDPEQDRYVLAEGARAKVIAAVAEYASR